MTLVYLVLVLHFIADFTCQTRWMAENKCKSLYALGSHIAAYSLVFFIALSILNLFGVVGNFWPEYVILNGMLHFLTDYYTSRMTKKFANQFRWYEFFLVLGCDQLIHQFCLIGTLFLIS